MADVEETVEGRSQGREPTSVEQGEGGLRCEEEEKSSVDLRFRFLVPILSLLPSVIKNF